MSINHNPPLRCIATCKLGLESVVATELRALNLPVESVQDARVCFLPENGQGLFRALIFLRTAERVLLEIASFPATSFDMLFEGVRALPWKRYIPKDAFIHVNGKSAKSTLFSVSDCQSITKKAIVESLRAAYRIETIPETGPELIIEVGMLRDTATLALDACGAGLSRRGYRTYNVSAPLSETLGAGLVLLSRYRGDRPFLDPMCGSGTIPIEAAMIAQNRAPGLGRDFAAENWAFLSPSDARLAREEALDSIRNIPIEIEGSDIDPRSIGLCKQHAKKAGVMLKWTVRPLRELPPQPNGGILVTNPPYGERMLSIKETVALYKELRAKCDDLTGWSMHIISAYREFEKAFGKHAHKRRKLSNGGMPCTLYQYFPQQI